MGPFSAGSDRHLHRRDPPRSLNAKKKGKDLIVLHKSIQGADLTPHTRRAMNQSFLNPT